MRDIASESGLSVAAVSRHVRIHLRPELRRAAPAEHVASFAADFAARLLGIANDAADQRQQSREQEDTKLVLAALREERAALHELATTLGITDQQVVADLQEAKALVLAVRDVILDREPELAEHLAHELERRDQPQLADGLRSLVTDPPPRHFHALPTTTTPKELP